MLSPVNFNLTEKVKCNMTPNIFSMLRTGIRNVAKRSIAQGLEKNTVVVLDSCRTPFTKSMTAYDDLMPHDLLRGAVSATVKRTGIDINEIDYGTKYNTSNNLIYIYTICFGGGGVGGVAHILPQNKQP